MEKVSLNKIYLWTNVLLTFWPRVQSDQLIILKSLFAVLTSFTSNFSMDTFTRIYNQTCRKRQWCLNKTEFYMPHCLLAYLLKILCILTLQEKDVIRNSFRINWNQFKGIRLVIKFCKTAFLLLYFILEERFNTPFIKYMCLLSLSGESRALLF